jgi:prepilin-type N-terminal cleavage/methylation domain-containing protein
MRFDTGYSTFGKPQTRRGLTLVELLIVVGIIGLLASMLLGAATLIRNQSKEQLTRSTIGILVGALRQFHDYEYRYNPDGSYSDFVFPLDCNDNGKLAVDRLIATLTNELGALVSVGPIGVVHDPNYSGSEGLYFFLSRVPQCRETLEEIDGSLITSEDENGQQMVLNIAGELVSLLRVIDPWGRSLHYDYYDEITGNHRTRRSFPVITSAGPDGQFGAWDDATSDDISSIGM